MICYLQYMRMEMDKKKISIQLVFFCLLIEFPIGIFAQENYPLDVETPEKFALVIGNSAYMALTPLANPVNDADDIATALEKLGFSVEKILNGTLDQMENGVLRLKERVSKSRNSYGFFFYAGHGVQSGGENYLIPVNANIPSENFLRSRAVSVQLMLDELSDARNELNVVVLDACRDNPFGWSRSQSRGLAYVNRQPIGSIIVYATSAGAKASDGIGRNGLFTSQFLINLETPGLEVSEVFRRTGADVSLISGQEQIPAIYNQFFGIAYLGERPAQAAALSPPIAGRPSALPSPEQQIPGKKQRDSSEAARLWTVGASVGSAFATPRFIGTVRGTIAPFRNIFLELGMDLGLISSYANAGYFSLYPFAHFAYYMPFGKNFGWYAGIGAGYMIAQYTFAEGQEFPEGRESIRIFAGDVIAGVNLFDMIDISYTLRSNFQSASNKLSVGYTWRFK